MIVNILANIKEQHIYYSIYQSLLMLVNENTVDNCSC